MVIPFQLDKLRQKGLANIYMAEYSTLRRITDDCEDRQEREKLWKLTKKDSEGILTCLLSVANKIPGEPCRNSYRSQFTHFSVVLVKLRTRKEPGGTNRRPLPSVGAYVSSFQRYKQLLERLSMDRQKAIYLLSAGCLNNTLAEHLGYDFELRHSAVCERYVHQGTIKTFSGNTTKSVVIALARKDR